jgi:hypothetical protein
MVILLISGNPSFRPTILVVEAQSVVVMGSVSRRVATIMLLTMGFSLST